MELSLAVRRYMSKFQGIIPSAEAERINEFGFYLIVNDSPEYTDLWADAAYAKVDGVDHTLDVRLSLYWPGGGCAVIVGNNEGDGFNALGEAEVASLSSLAGAIEAAAKSDRSGRLRRILVEHCTADHFIRSKLAALEAHIRTSAAESDAQVAAPRKPLGSFRPSL